MTDEFRKFQSLMSSFLGSPKGSITDDGQLQFNCPRCREDKGCGEDGKFNLEINIFKGFQCWSCGSIHDEMKGSISKLIKLYGNDEIMREYRDLITAMRNSSLYRLSFQESKDPIVKEELCLPPNYRKITDKKYVPKAVYSYLWKRGIKWEIIDEFNLGYTCFDEANKMASSRIVIPSFNSFGELNYWTGRDYTGIDHRQKYFNPKIDRKSIIFNEEKIQWDADVTLVEGPFDHLVVPNSIPLLGKHLGADYKIYQEIVSKANANINIFLDGDALDDVIEIYKLLNHDNLYGRIRFIPCKLSDDPSQIYQDSGRKGIIDHLRGARQLDEILLR